MLSVKNNRFFPTMKSAVPVSSYKNTIQLKVRKTNKFTYLLIKYEFDPLNIGFKFSILARTSSRLSPQSSGLLK